MGRGLDGRRGVVQGGASKAHGVGLLRWRPRDGGVTGMEWAGGRGSKRQWRPRSALQDMMRTWSFL